jgi:hypothetical protein
MAATFEADAIDVDEKDRSSNPLQLSGHADSTNNRTFTIFDLQIEPFNLGLEVVFGEPAPQSISATELVPKVVQILLVDFPTFEKLFLPHPMKDVLGNVQFPKVHPVEPFLALGREFGPDFLQVS